MISPSSKFPDTIANCRQKSEGQGHLSRILAMANFPSHVLISSATQLLMDLRTRPKRPPAPCLPGRASDPVCFWPPCWPPCTGERGRSFPGGPEETNAFREDFIPNRATLASSALPCCTGQKCEAPCSRRRSEKRCLPRKTADAPDVGQNPAGTPFPWQVCERNIPKL